MDTGQQREAAPNSMRQGNKNEHREQHIEAGYQTIKESSTRGMEDMEQGALQIGPRPWKGNEEALRKDGREYRKGMEAETAPPKGQQKQGTK